MKAAEEARRDRDAGLVETFRQTPQISCAEMGRLFGLQAPSVRQILKRDAPELWAQEMMRRRPWQLAGERGAAIRARDVDIVESFRNPGPGTSYAELGRRHGISRWWVRQILKRDAPELWAARDAAMRARRAVVVAEDAARRRRVEALAARNALIVESLRQYPGMTFAGLGEMAGISAEMVSKVVRRQAGDLLDRLRARRRGNLPPAGAVRPSPTELQELRRKFQQVSGRAARSPAGAAARHPT